MCYTFYRLFFYIRYTGGGQLKRQILKSILESRLSRINLLLVNATICADIKSKDWTSSYLFIYLFISFFCVIIQCIMMDGCHKK